MHDKRNRTLDFLPAAIVRPIDDDNDPRIREIAALKERAERDRTGQFQIEGLRFLIQATEQNFPIDSLVYARSELKLPLAIQTARRLIDAGVPALEVTPRVLRELAYREDPQGVIAVTRQRWQPLAMATPSAGLCWLAVDSIQSAGNLGTLLRTLDCVGGAGLILVGDTVDPYDPGCVRATMGAIFNQRMVRATFEELQNWAHRHRAAIVGTSPTAKDDYHSACYRRPTILFIGSERKGLSNDTQSRCDMVVRIPMVGRSDSLNLSVAASIVLYEVFQQHSAARPLSRQVRNFKNQF